MPFELKSFPNYNTNGQQQSGTACFLPVQLAPLELDDRIFEKLDTDTFRTLPAVLLLCCLGGSEIACADTLPIKEGIWASPGSACGYAKTQKSGKSDRKWPIDLTEGTLKTAEKRGHAFWYFDKNLQHFGSDIGECETRRIVGDGSRFRITIYCGEDGEGGERTDTTVEVKSSTELVLTEGDGPPEEYAFCEKIK